MPIDFPMGFWSQKHRKHRVCKGEISCLELDIFCPYIFQGTNDESPKERAARFLPSWGSVYESCGDRWQRNPRGVNEG